MKLAQTFSLSDREIRYTWLQFISFGALLFGLRLWVIGSYGNAIPFWDQWDAEGVALFKPFVAGKLGFSDLFIPHNEDRTLTGRVLSLALLKINTQWNPVLQMVVNAFLFTGLIMLVNLFIGGIVGKKHLPVLLLFSLLLFGIPYAWENTLSGFQSPFYFVILFSIASLWLISIKDPLSFGWWIGLLCGLLAFFSLASGIVTLGAATFTSFIVFITNRRRTPKQLTAVTILFILFLTCIKQTPVVPGHAVLKANSFGEFLHAAAGILGWPIASSFLIAVFRNLPIIIFIIGMFRKPPEANSGKWFLFALSAWSLGQVISLASGKAAISLSSRYLDLFAVTILLNFACLLLLTQQYFSKWRFRPVIFGLIWTAVTMISLARKGMSSLPADLSAKRENNIAQQTNTRNYLATGDTSFVRNKPLFQIPYPDANRFEWILSQPEIRTILPTNVNPGLLPSSVEPGTAEGFVKNGYFPSTTGYLDSSWGSYNRKGDTATGTLTLRFAGTKSGGRILIPVAGYPLEGGIKLAVEQNGKSFPVNISENPKEKWNVAATSIGSGPFSISASDSSSTTWIALGKPIVSGRFDKLTDWTLSHYYLFLLFGIVMAVLLVFSAGFKEQEINSTAINAS